MNVRSCWAGGYATAGQERGETTKEILKAALDLFLRQGYHATTMRQIASAARIVPGALYNHFASKEALYLSLLRDAGIYSAVGEALETANGETAEALLRDGAHRLLATLRAHSEMIPLLLVDVLEFDARNVAVLASEAVPHVVSFFARVTILGSKNGELRPIRPDVLARAFLGLFVSYFMTARFFSRVVSQYPGLGMNADIVDDFLDIFTHGVLRASATGAAKGE